MDFSRAACALVAALLVAGCSPLDKRINADNVYGRTGRLAQLGADAKLGPLEGQDEFDRAKVIFDEAAAIKLKAKEAERLDKAHASKEHDRALAKYALAQKEFKRLRKKYKDKPIEEDAMFYLGECYYEQGYYPWAQDLYDELLDKYTSSRYIEPITRRMYYIARVWLNQPKPASEIERVEFTGEARDKPVPKDTLPPRVATLVPNFSDRTRPLFDAEGRATNALKSIWLKDPTGPLADDALLLSATYHLRRRNFKEADDLFNILRSEYPQSEHAQNAYLLGSHVKLLTYQGPSYDDKQLDEAGKLIDSTIRLFPDIPEQERLQRKLAGTKEAAAARDWDRVQFYLRKGAKPSAAIYCQYILRDHPDSQYAIKAADLLKRLAPPKKPASRKPTAVSDVSADETSPEDAPADEPVTVETGPSPGGGKDLTPTEETSAEELP